MIHMLRENKSRAMYLALQVYVYVSIEIKLERHISNENCPRRNKNLADAVERKRGGY